MKPGPDIIINGTCYPTIIDDNYVQRFNSNRAVRFLIDKYRPLNDLWEHYGEPDDDLRQLYRLMGYSICGYAEVFPDDKIDNPMWE